MTAPQLRQTLIALRKEMRKQRVDDDAWLSGILFEVINSTSGAQLEYEQVCNLSHASFACALPPPLKNAPVRNFAERVRPHLDALGETACGWLYQLYCEESRTASQQAFQQSNKQCSMQERIAFTQIYTPAWVADYLLNHCLEETAGAAGREPKTILDPACGGGNILSRALTLLSGRMMQQKVADPWNAALANIYGADIDARALFVANISLLAQVARSGESFARAPNLLCLGGSDLGSLDRQSDLGSLGRQSDLGSLDRQPDNTQWFSPRTRYSAVVTNPPYIGRKLLDRKLKDMLKEAYPLAHNDISAAFLLRGLELLEDGGKLGLITQSAQFFLPSFQEMRAHILEHYHIDSFVELGAGAFPLQTGEKVSSALLVVSKSSPDSSPSLFIDLSNAEDKYAAISTVAAATTVPAANTVAAANGSQYRCDQRQFLTAGSNAFNYKAPPCLQRLSQVCTPLSELADVRQGLATTDNGRFVKPWRQVAPHEIGSRWVPYVKGAGSERWWAPIDNVVLWEDSGAAIKQAVRESYPYLNGKTAWVVKNEAFYFRAGLVFSFVNTRQFCARLLPAGCIFDVAASAIFPNAEADRLILLAFLNSAFCALQANLLNPTINFQVGDLKKFLVPAFDQESSIKLSTMAQSCLSIKQAINKPKGTICGKDAEQPTMSSHEWMLYCAERLRELTAVEHAIDSLVLDCVSRALELNEAEYNQLKELCAEQQKKRRAPTIPAVDFTLGITAAQGHGYTK